MTGKNLKELIDALGISQRKLAEQIVADPKGIVAYYAINKYLDGKNALARAFYPRQMELDRQFRDLLTSLSASIAAGRQMEEALAEACDNLSLLYEPDALIMKELRYMKRSIRENRETDRSLLSDFAARAGSEDIRSFVQVYLTCRGTGGDLQQIITHSSEILSEKMKISEQIHVITAQKKLEGRLICLMPAAMLLALNLLSPAYISVLYAGIAGRLIMTLCLGGAAAGIVLMEKMTDVEV